jgi:hypothetical protein
MHASDLTAVLAVKVPERMHAVHTHGDDDKE